jgi:hypothetical protein
MAELGNPASPRRLRADDPATLPRAARMSAAKKVRQILSDPEQGLSGLHPKDLRALYPNEQRWLREGGLTEWGAKWTEWKEEGARQRQERAFVGDDADIKERVKRGQQKAEKLKACLEPLLVKYRGLLADADLDLGDKRAHAAMWMAKIDVSTTCGEIERAMKALDKIFGQYVQSVQVAHISVRDSEAEILKRIKRMEGWGFPALSAGKAEVIDVPAVVPVSEEGSS